MILEATGVKRIVLDKNWHCLPVKSKDDWRQKPLDDAGFFKTELPGPGRSFQLGLNLKL